MQRWIFFLTLPFFLGVTNTPPSIAESHKGTDIAVQNTRPLEVSDWQEVECRSDGTCIQKNSKGETRIVDAKSKQPKVVPLSKEELKALNTPEIEDLSDLKKRVAAARKAGQKYFVIQVGNLQGCPPCRALNASLRSSALAKDAQIGIFDMNYLQKQNGDLAKLFHRMGLPAQFSFPHVFVLEVAKDEDWFSRYLDLASAEASVSSVKDAIEKFKTKAK